MQCTTGTPSVLVTVVTYEKIKIVILSFNICVLFSDGYQVVRTEIHTELFGPKYLIYNC